MTARYEVTLEDEDGRRTQTFTVEADGRGHAVNRARSMLSANLFPLPKAERDRWKVLDVKEEEPLGSLEDLT